MEDDRGEWGWIPAALGVLACISLIALFVTLSIWAIRDRSWLFAALALIDGLVATYLLIAGAKQYRREREQLPAPRQME
jgi:Flp pilus assembly protein TadB